jgi:large subunit ribosomal protein L25
MPEITLVAEVGRPTGSRPARRLRAGGRIPAVLYGDGVEPMAVSVSARELRAALSTEAGMNAVLRLEAGSATHLVMAREIQRHPVRGTVAHVDFQVVDPDQPVVAEVPVVLVGEAVELHHQDGMLDQQLFTLPVRAKPARLPHQIELDVSSVVVGSALRVADVLLPEGVTAEADPELIVVMGQAQRLARAEAGAEAAAEAETAGGAGAHEAARSEEGAGAGGGSAGEAEGS